MTDSPITLADIALAASITAAVFGIVFQLLKLGMSFLTARFGTKEMTVAEQSAQCRFDHGEINNMIVQQNSNIAKMIAQNGEQIKALTDINHNAQLRHQIVLAKLERIEDHIRH